LKTRAALRAASLGNGQGERVTIEGTIGTLSSAEFVEETILELVGTEGVLRVDLSRDDLLKRSKKTEEGEVE